MNVSLTARTALLSEVSQKRLWGGNNHRRARAFATETLSEASIPDLLEHRYLFRFMTWDIRSKRINETMRKMQLLIRAAGGELCGGVASPRDRTERLAVLRSPFVDKKSQEHFERVTRFRVLRWRWRASPPPQLPAIDMGHAVAIETPPGYGVRVTETRNGLVALAFFFPDSPEPHFESERNDQSPVAGVDAPQSLPSSGRAE
ncbi:hypothetical protein F1559_003376 [Cyanidiococcus yangmingshanensis]|uniref:Small ribosomal subunit protein uS10 domain-containing protein n=1 Tax=Cyanidiococcus yangmingshanensis TaxID=2690220 RepID=A0A7J7IMC9_9RHOD|nr:hypothetical protein F1559_003376 [Cyanidiococcus yangmingshanensis]